VEESQEVEVEAAGRIHGSNSSRHSGEPELDVKPVVLA